MQGANSYAVANERRSWHVVRWQVQGLCMDTGILSFPWKIGKRGQQ